MYNNVLSSLLFLGFRNRQLAYLFIVTILMSGITSIFLTKLSMKSLRLLERVVLFEYLAILYNVSNGISFETIERQPDDAHKYSPV